jgi:hypothetical protein
MKEWQWARERRRRNQKKTKKSFFVVYRFFFAKRDYGATVLEICQETRKAKDRGQLVYAVLLFCTSCEEMR